VLPGATEYQPLHRDQGDFLADQSGRLDFRDLPCSRITVNYPIEVVQGSPVGHTRSNGCTRQIVGTQRSREPIPTLEEECAAPTRTSTLRPCSAGLTGCLRRPEWMQLAVTGPCPAGCALIRDCRAWHGGTPNLSRGVRAIPSVAVSAPWYNGADRRGPRSNSERVPRSVFNGLSAHGAAFGPVRKRLDVSYAERVRHRRAARGSVPAL